MGMRKLYLDLDDTYVDTENYIRKVLNSNGVDCDQNESVWDVYFRGDTVDIFREILADYSAIPKKVGAEECLKILETEFEIVYVTCYICEEEHIAKLDMAKEDGREIIFCPDFDKSHIDMQEGVFIDDVPKHLINSSVKDENKYLMYNKYVKDLTKCLMAFNGTVVFDWYDFCDKVMEVNVDAELRDSICSRIPKCIEKCRV